MGKIAIKDIYAGMPDAKDEVNSGHGENFIASFIVPPGLPINSLLEGEKYLVTGYKGVGKTSVLYYLEDLAKKADEKTCSSFMYFKSDFEEVRKSSIEAIGKKLTSIIDLSGEIQPNKVEYLHIWRWVFFKKIVDDSQENERKLFVEDGTWRQFVDTVNRISFSSEDKRTLSLSSLSVSVQASPASVFSGSANLTFDRVQKNEAAFRQLIDVVNQCESLFKQLTITEVPYYLFVDEMEAFYGDIDLLKRDLTLIRDIIFTVHRLNEYKKVKIIAAVRNEIIYAMDRFIPTNEINKIIDGFGVPVRWSYSNTNSIEHPIIKILMRRISIVSGMQESFADWFPDKINGKDTVNYILDNGWNKPRDIVRFLTAAKNDAIHSSESRFSQATFDSLRKEYSKNSLSEIRQELQALYKTEEIELVLRLLRGGSRFTTLEELYKAAAKGSKAREFLDSRADEVLEDFYRVGLWGNVNRTSERFTWRWNHKGDTGVLNRKGWELAIHPALYSELSIITF